MPDLSLHCEVTAVDHRDHAAVFAAAVEAWLASGPAPDIADLARGAGLSIRQVQRRCRQAFGASPRTLARRRRALRTALAIAERREEADQLIAEGFCDQSHLIRELKCFTGRTPGEVRGRPAALARIVAGVRAGG